MAYEKVNEFNQETVPQSHTADQPRAPRGRTTDNNNKATNFLFLFNMISKLEWTQSIA